MMTVPPPALIPASVFPKGCVPVTSVPMKLPSIHPNSPDCTIPVSLPEMTLGKSTAPMSAGAPRWIPIDDGIGDVPVASVPMRFPDTEMVPSPMW